MAFFKTLASTTAFPSALASMAFSNVDTDDVVPAHTFGDEDDAAADSATASACRCWRKAEEGRETDEVTAVDAAEDDEILDVESTPN